MRRRSTWLAVSIGLLIAALVLGVDRLVPPVEPEDPPVSTPVASTPAGGSWVCAAGDGREGTELELLAARAGGIGAAPAAVELLELREGELTPRTLPALFPPSHMSRSLGLAGDDTAVAARWSGGPIALLREWRWEGDDDLPAASVAGPCARPFSGQWVVPGMTTAGGNEARLRLANPYRTDATFAVRFVTPEGVESPIALQNVSVPARSVREIVVNDLLPERDDLGAIVEVATGRLAVEGYQITRAAIGGVDGGSLLAAAAAPAEEWTIPWVADDDDWSSWLWIANTGDRTAPVELSLHTSDGGQVPDGLSEVTVPPGQLQRIDLTGTLPDGVVVASVSVRSNGVPIVVSAASRFGASEILDPEDPDQELDHGRTGLSIQLGLPELDSFWITGGGRTEGRRERLRVVNPAGEPAEVDIVLFDGSTLIEPEDLQGMQLPAGSARTLIMTDYLGQASSWSAFVRATTGQIAVGRVSTTDEGPARVMATVGVPSSAWTPIGQLLAGREVEGMVRHLGTTLGLRPEDPFADPDPVVDEPVVPGDPDGPEPATDLDDLDPDA